MEEYRSAFADLESEAKVNLVGVSGGPPGSSLFLSRIFGPDLKGASATFKMKAIALLEAQDGPVNVSSSLQIKLRICAAH